MICEKYYVQGPKKGTIEKFCDLPGMPDNIHYDGQGHYLIAMVTVMYPHVSLLTLTSMGWPATIIQFL